MYLPDYRFVGELKTMLIEQLVISGKQLSAQLG
jgi:hypothetical protein